MSKDSCNIVKTKQVLIIVEDGLKLQCACGTLLTYGKFHNTEKKLSFHMAHIRDHLCSSRHGLALGWTYQNGKVERYMHPSAKRAFGADVERSRNLIRKFFGAACSDVNMTNSKDKRENSQTFNKSHLQKQGGASQNIDTRTCPASREVHHAVEDTQKKREIAIIEAGVSERYISKEKNIKALCQRHNVEFQAGRLNCEKVFNEVRLSVTEAELLEERIENSQLLRKRKQDDCLLSSLPMDISIQIDTAKRQAHYVQLCFQYRDVMEKLYWQDNKLLANELECGQMSSNLFESQASEITVAQAVELQCKVELLEGRCKLIQANVDIIKEDYLKKIDAIKRVFEKDQLLKSKFQVGLYYPIMAQKV